MAEPEEHVQERFTVPPELEGQRADAAVAALTGLSRSAAAVLCAEGRVLHRDRPVAKSFRVEASQTSMITVQRGAEERNSYSCTPYCQPSVQLGDSTKYFGEVSGQAESRRSLATAGSTPAGH